MIFTLYLRGLYQPRSFYRISDQRDYILFNAIKREHQSHILEKSIDLAISVYPLAKSGDKVLDNINNSLSDIFQLNTNNPREIERKLINKNKALKNGLTGDEGVDNLIRLHKLLTKLGYISKD